ncbi:predicted protein [Plenodomus lingam JN3]|uniref:Predicted protein n=1 Tax=Leptosphaeria maculans (strain JN3 / isolate v23.1.3 / race Av1-4-5-6-7-8) TaxID=985895 RepID=E4ZWK7_LEPMJ|nr:predicted protein [Plenodomus lingam JN3]CBX95983.1 predicted protein [Plenodomus lingam JN3]
MGTVDGDDYITKPQTAQPHVLANRSTTHPTQTDVSVQWPPYSSSFSLSPPPRPMCDAAGTARCALPAPKRLPTTSLHLGLSCAFPRSPSITRPRRPFLYKARPRSRSTGL